MDKDKLILTGALSAGVLGLLLLGYKALAPRGSAPVIIPPLIPAPEVDLGSITPEQVQDSAALLAPLNTGQVIWQTLKFAALNTTFAGWLYRFASANQ